MERANIDRTFVLADAIAGRVAYSFMDPKDRSEDMILQKWQVYPELYEDTKAQAEERKANEELERVKASRRAFADRWNSRFEGEKDNESGSPQTDSLDRGTTE